ncbi:MAG: DUF4249 domain-containing protein [Reichenbachiella sp.]|uniref:DUF4249 domain-containing protein n=1 Tax=Reichenbachiella sp. TaxID=2184521 RepID=UPI003267C387
MKKIIQNIGLSLIISLMTACSEEINLDIPQGIPRLVVDGKIELNVETNETVVNVKLSTTAAYFDSSEPPFLSEVSASIYDETGTIYPLTAQAPGIYGNRDLNGTIGAAYRLVITWNDERYEAETILLSVPMLQDIHQINQEATFFDDAGIKLAVDFQDPVQEKNYYHFEQYRNDSLLLTPTNGNQFQLIIKDEFFNGQMVESYIPGDEFSFLPGDLGRVKMRSLDKKAFNYYKLFYEKSVDEPSFIVGETPPVAIKGNIINQTTPDHYGLGYFLATQITTRSTNIE